MNQTIATDNPFRVEEQDIMRELAGLIVPDSPEYAVPGADDELIFADILHSALANEHEIKSGIEYAIGLDCPLSEAITELEGRPEVAAFVSLVMQCYYRDDRVMESLGMEPRPPFPEGFEVEEGDWSMLEPVQRRGKIWRDA
jgi:hypothetical protein